MRELGKSFIDEYLYDIEKAGIHSYRYRTKDAWHLLEKVIRKKKENPEKFDKEYHRRRELLQDILSRQDNIYWFNLIYGEAEE